MVKRKRHSGPCALEGVIAVFATKWKPVLLFHLFENGTLRHGEIRRLLPDISQRILTQQLREMERDGLVTREQFQVVPPKVEYSATKLAWTVKPIFETIEAWGNENMRKIETNRERYDADNSAKSKTVRED